MRRWVAVVALLFAACGAQAVKPADDLVAAAQESMQERERGRLDFTLKASAEGSDPVGFTIAGDYDFESDELAVVDLTYDLFAGNDTTQTRVVSDGDRAVVVADDEVHEVPAALAKSLKTRDAGVGGVPAFDLTAWVRNAKVKSDGDTTTVRGKLDVPAFIGDLQRIASQVAGASTKAISGEDAERIAAAVTSSEIKLTTAGDSNDLRSISAFVEFGARVPPELRKALGNYAGARLDLSVKIANLAKPLEVELPE